MDDQKSVKQKIEHHQSKSYMNHLFGVGAIIFIAFLSATYIPQEYIDQLKSYFIGISKEHSVSLDSLIEPKILHQLLKNNDFDQNYRLIETFFGQESEKNFQNEHIPKAIYFDVIHRAEDNKLIPKNIINLREFEDYISSLGISNHHHVIIYDRSEFGFFTSTRAWYLFKLYGSDKITIVNGGLNAWKSQKFETTNEKFIAKKELFIAKYDKNLIRNFEDVIENLKTNKELLIDSREANEFNTIQSETNNYEHIPNSINLPYTELFDLKKKTLKKTSELIELFREKKIDLDKPIIVSCMYGVRSCTTFFSAYLIGSKSISLYPGSWNEFSFRIKGNKN